VNGDGACELAILDLFYDDRRICSRQPAFGVPEAGIDSIQLATCE
jgi:hypothetical protein